MTHAKSLEDLVRSNVADAVDFAQLCERCEGAWPGAVRAILDALDENADARRLLAGICVPAAERLTQDRRLPQPHPLDADWRFATQSAETILDILLERAGRYGEILLIGTPSIALAARDRGIAHRIVVAARRHDPLIHALKAAGAAQRCIIIGERTPLRFKAIAIDPPWYDDVALELTGFANACAAEGAAVFLCAPDRFTAPTAADRLSKVGSEPEHFGFSSVVTTARIRYETPFFELRCLGALGIHNVSPCWRTGALHECIPAPKLVHLALTSEVGARDWQEQTFGTSRIWLRCLPMRRFPPDDRGPVVKIAASISRSDPNRALADLWTSGNTIMTGVGRIDAKSLANALTAPRTGHWSEQLAQALLAETKTAETALVLR